MKKKTIVAVVLAGYALFVQFFIKVPEISAFPAAEGAFIDLFTQKEPYSGRGLNQPSDAFGPEQKVILYANVTYNLSPLEGKAVTFEIKGPPNNVSNIFFILNALTNSTGIAAVNFTIPWYSENPETIVFGLWNVRATVSVAEQTVRDELTFNVGWIIEIISLQTLDKDFQVKTSFMQGTNLTAELTLKSIALGSKEAAFAVGAIDSFGHVLNTVFVSDFEVSPGLSYMNVSLRIPEWAKLGDAQLYAGAYTALPSLGGSPYCPEVSTVFKITLLGDLNEDGVVNIKDIATAAIAFGTYPGHPRWNPIADLNQDDKIDIKDIALIARNFGKTDP